MLCAAVILANKCDLATDEELGTTLNACRVLNENASIISTTFGNATLWDLLPLRTSVAATLPPDEHASTTSAEHEFMLNGLNCGGCGNALRKALMSVEGGHRCSCRDQDRHRRAPQQGCRGGIYRDGAA